MQFTLCWYQSTLNQNQLNDYIRYYIRYRICTTFKGTTFRCINSKYTIRFGFMFAGYEEGYEWWETVVMLRKCCFVLLAIFLRQYGAASQVVAASLVLVVVSTTKGIFSISISILSRILQYQNNVDFVGTCGFHVSFFVGRK